ncbi:alpha-hydroxy-acid oxidizing protein [Paracoccus yeei]|uniref:alpha-hydroxy-acid oxidizing protein n=1 Tax=Paracoccus yeei TaxID=147645 RepID=UPI00289D9B50|nr:alpha-hydroxy-acid oxidizing protein [Paracoccus yeei]
MKNRAFIERLIARARAANCSALVLTLDCQIQGQRHRDIRNGLSTPPRPTLRNLANLATKPGWCLGCWAPAAAALATSSAMSMTCRMSVRSRAGSTSSSTGR